MTNDEPPTAPKWPRKCRRVGTEWEPDERVVVMLLFRVWPRSHWLQFHRVVDGVSLGAGVRKLQFGYYNFTNAQLEIVTE